MSSIVKLNAVKIPRYFDCTLLSAFSELVMHRNGFCLELRGARVIASAGEKAGEEVVGPVKANQRVYLPLGILHPIRYTAMICINPELMAMGDVNVATMAEPREDTPFVIRFKALAECEPAKLPWLVRIYLLD